jgi:hypothetical protein
MKDKRKVILQLLAILIFINLHAFKVQAQKINVHLVEACGYKGSVRQNYSCNDDVPQTLEKLISNMITFSGFKGDRINIFDTDQVDLPVIGVDTLGFVTILVNEKKIGKRPSWYVLSILSHELGHVYRRHLYLPDCVTKEHELQADYYAGFFAHRANCPLLDSVIAPYKNLVADEDHPSSEIRIGSVISGWTDAALPFKLNTADSLTMISKNSFANKFKKFADLFVTVTPYRKFLNTNIFYNVTFHLTSNDPGLPVDSIVSNIDMVSYLLDRESFTTPLVPSYNVNGDNYGYTLTKVWGEFPLKCVIYFKDDSILPIVKEFKLPEKPKLD